MATSDFFFGPEGMDRARVESLVDDSLKSADDGELFLEYCQSESFSFDDGRLKNAMDDIRYYNIKTMQAIGMK